MGDHRASIKIEFTMHGVTSKADMWINWWVGAAHDLPSSVTGFFAEAEAKSLHSFWDARDDAAAGAAAEKKRLIDSAAQKLTHEEREALGLINQR